MEQIVFNYTIAAKFFAIMALTTTANRYENWGVIGSATIYTLIIMMFHIFIELLGINFHQEFSTSDIIFKFSINFFPALLYFWLLKWNSGLRYWGIFLLGMGYFFYITKYTVMV